MMIEKERINRMELLFGFACYMQATMLRSIFISGITGIDSWAMALTGALVNLPMLIGYVTLARWYPGKCLFEINEELFGPVIGRVFSGIYMYFFLTLSALNSLDLSHFVLGNMMPGASMVLVLVAFIIACVYAVRKGLESFMRLAPLLSIGAVLIVLTNVVLVIKDASISYLFPMFQQPLIKYVQGTHITSTIPFGEGIVFLMIIPSLGHEKSAGKPLLISLLMSALFMAGIIFRDIICLGPLINYVSLPTFEAVRMINLANVITRIESLYALMNIALLYFKVSLLLYACTRGLAQMTRLKQYKHLALAVGSFVCVYALTVYDSEIVHGYMGSFFEPFLFLIFEYLMPSIALLTAVIRRGRARKEGANA